MYGRSSVTESVAQDHGSHEQRSCHGEEMYVRLQYIVEGLRCMLNLEQEFQARNCGVRCGPGGLEIEVGLLLDYSVGSVHQSAGGYSEQAVLCCEKDVTSICAARFPMLRPLSIDQGCPPKAISPISQYQAAKEARDKHLAAKCLTNPGSSRVT
jgi:hypothetical protein